ncbi:IS3 family transposase [Thermodesulfovibrio aggregans]|uniref:IS3 family transposase n=1 Tax=Thermodesulfovibrio aggregans TaxID=86166 RepID=UPI00350E4B93
MSFESFEEARNRIKDWITNDYNNLYLYSKLGYLSSEEFKLKYLNDRGRNSA